MCPAARTGLQVRGEVTAGRWHPACGCLRLPEGRVCRHVLLACAQGKGRHEEAALQAAENVLGSTLIAVKGRNAAKV